MSAKPLQAPRRIVATLGPASFDQAAQLVAAGADALRLNASHLSPAALGEALASLAASVPETALYVDLQGAKMRLGDFPARGVKRGEVLRFAAAPAGPEILPLPHRELLSALEEGEILSSDDGRIRLRVRRCSGELLEAECLDEGILAPRKGINRADHPIDPDDLSALDLEHTRTAAGYPQVMFACSFMRDGREARWIRRRAPGCRVVAKVERRAALDAIAALAALCDELWICRGDLGVQLGTVALAREVAALRPRSIAPPVLMAGQVLEHLTQHRHPTRSEVCHLHDLLERGYAGIVLSDETAIGRDPVGAVAMAASLVRTLWNFRREPRQRPG